MTWWVGTVIAVAGIQLLEYMNRTMQFDNFLVALKYTAVVILIGQYGLWKSWSGAPSLLMAWVMFFSLNVACRTVLLTYLVGEPPSVGQLAGS